MQLVIASLVLALVSSRAADARPMWRSYVEAGAIIPLFDYSDYGPAVPISAGVNVALGTHRILGLLEYGRYSGTYLMGPAGSTFPVDGLTLDTGSLRVAWRWTPAITRGLHVGFGTGVTALHDRVRVMLPGRDASSTQNRVGTLVDGALGWTWKQRVDTTFSVRVTRFAGEGPAYLSAFTFAVGVRL